MEGENEEIIYPNIFSPNDDNINDNWMLDLTDYPENELTVYDRWGNRVAYWQNQNEIIWDGSWNGDLLAQGVYVFVLNYKGETKMESLVGNITLLR